MWLTTMDGQHFIFLQQMVVMNQSRFLPILELIFTLTLKMVQTVYILQHVMDISIFVKLLQININLINMWLTTMDGQHFIFLQQMVVMNQSHFLPILELIFISKLKTAQTVYTLQQGGDISIFAKLLQKNINLISM